MAVPSRPMRFSGFSRGTFPVLFRDPNLFRKPSKTRGNSRFLRRAMVEKNGESTLDFSAYWGFAFNTLKVKPLAEDLRAA